MVTVESPTDCRIFLKYTSHNEGEVIKEILLTQVLNYRISENKRPVYGFNQKKFGQVVEGKHLVEGVIVLKKSILGEVGNLLSFDLKNTSEMESVENKLDYLKKQLIGDPAMQSLFDEYESQIKKEWSEEVNEYISTKKYDIFNDLPSSARVIIAFGSHLNSDEFKEKVKSIAGSNSSIKASQIERAIIENSELVMESINFTEKAGEVNISKNDIDEVYKFFANLKE